MTIDHSMPSSSKFDINPKLNSYHHKTIQDIIQSNYLDIENIPAIEHNYEMSIKVTSDIPISYKPRRLVCGQINCRQDNR